jgi:hypothetical protein
MGRHWTPLGPPWLFSLCAGLLAFAGRLLGVGLGFSAAAPFFFVFVFFGQPARFSSIFFGQPGRFFGRDIIRAKLSGSTP